MRKSYFLSLGLSCWCKVQKEAVPVGRGGMRPAVLLQLHWLMPAAMFSAAIDRVFVAPPSVPVGGPVVPCFGMSRSCSVSGDKDEKLTVENAKRKLTAASD